jgi:DNA-binding MarR family transcriptional regulator
MQKAAATEQSEETTIESDVTDMHAVMLDLGRLGPLRDPIAGACESSGLTPPQIHTLISLGHDGGLPMGELARRGGITEKTMTGIVDRLEQSGHVQRERDADDRRLVRVRLTDTGREAFATIEGHVKSRLRGFLELIDAEDRCALKRMLRKLQQRLAARKATPPEEQS